MKNSHFDLIVIGAGSAGISTARRSASHGARVAVIEAHRTGGTCALRGCVPKKLLLYAAGYGESLREAPGYGWSFPEAQFRMQVWADAKAKETKRLEATYDSLLQESGVTVLKGTPEIKSSHVVHLAGEVLTTKYIVLATGSSPIKDVLPGMETLFTSDDLLNLRALPESAVIIGAGYVGVEFASMLANLGVEITLVFPEEFPLKGFDQDLRLRLNASLKKSGVILKKGTQTVKVERTSEGWDVHLSNGEVLPTPWAMSSVGRRPNSSGLGLIELGIKIDYKKAVIVNESLETSLEDVFAVGDVTNRKNLTPVAIAEGRWLADRLFSRKSPLPIDLQTIATGVFTLPPLGSVGLTEELCKKPTTVFEGEFRPMRHAFTGKDEKSYIKLLVDSASDKVVGIHMSGTDAPEIIQSLAVAMSAGVTKAQFDQTMALHPTSAEEFVLLRTSRQIHG